MAITCPNSAKGSGSAPLRGYFVDGKKKEIPCMQVWEKEERVRDGEGEYCCSGFVKGQAVEMVLNTGASCTLVHQDLVPPEKVDASQTLQVQCAHCNISEYLTAQLEININDTTYKIRAGVSPTLPRYVRLERDVGNLVGLAVREANAFPVLTRLQKRKQERKDAIVLAWEISGGAKPKALEEIDGTVNGTCEEKEDDVIEFCDLDDSLFEGGTKKRKTRKDKRIARKD